MKALKILVATSVVFMSLTAHAADAVTVWADAVTAGAVTVDASGTTVSPGTSASLNVEGAPSVVSATPTSVTLEWAKVETAVSYVVKYSKNSVATSTDPNAVYDNETPPVTETGTTIDSLTEGVTYYFAVVALDKDGNESDSLSEELVVTIGANAASASGSTGAFALSSVTAKNTRTLTIEFSAALGADPVSVKLQKTLNSATIPVKEVVVDSANPTTATVTLDADLEGDSAYSLTVISAKDANGTNIAEGVNAIKEFTTVASLAPAVEVPLNAGGPESASGATASGATAPAAATELPATGTKENFILILALLSALAIVFAFRKKAA